MGHDVLLVLLTRLNQHSFIDSGNVHDVAAKVLFVKVPYIFKIWQIASKKIIACIPAVVF